MSRMIRVDEEVEKELKNKHRKFNSLLEDLGVEEIPLIKFDKFLRTEDIGILKEHIKGKRCRKI